MWRLGVKRFNGQVTTRIAAIALVGLGLFGVAHALFNLLGH
ncbi:hypothetical protein [Mesorhizobium sp.]|nr:hypothetical protein [Mesorhizobium sp.]